MPNRLTTALLTAAMAGLLSMPAFAPAQAEDPKAPAAEPAAQPQAQIPIKQVVLYSSGVGYFEHFGTVKGNGSTDLQFKAAQINDILKSLVLQDMDKGKIGVITYPSQDPVEKTLRSFQIDITGNPSMAELLNQLRGARIGVSVGAEKVSGTVLGVEKKPRPVGDAKDGTVVEVAFLNLITNDGAIRSVPLDDVRGLELTDPKLREELTRALAALAAARDTDKKPVHINFTGNGERRIRIGYVVETPVWKSSYRLVLSGDRPGEAGGDAAANGKEEPGGKPLPAGQVDKPAAGGAAVRGVSGALQGWAIVENQTDNDWNDVQLSLVSGRPISFIQDLYQPLYIPRPVVQPELYASLRPQTYDAGMDRKQVAGEFAGNDKDAMRREERADRANQRPGIQIEKESMARWSGSSLYEATPAAAPPMDPTASVASAASATKLGELFQYTVGSVSLPRQTSAMIPVVTDAVEVEKLSIFNAAVLPRNPLLGARLRNTTGKHLLQGPVTVLDGGKYAGDARIDDLPPGQERLISYGIDQQVLVQTPIDNQKSAIQTGKLVKGVLNMTRKIIIERQYVAENKGDTERTLIIEHPKMAGGWALVEPAKADETTDTLYRFKGKVAAGKATKLDVRLERVTLETVRILDLNDTMLLTYARTGEIPQPVRDALAKAAELRGALADTQRKVNELNQQSQQITQEQSRIRDNMKTVAQNTDYYQRLLGKLNDQETQIEALQKQIEKLQTQAEAQRKAMEDYVMSLNVG